MTQHLEKIGSGLGDRGSVSIMGAMFAIAFVFAGTLAIDMSNLYVVKLQSQRVTDLAALAAARTNGVLVNNAAPNAPPSYAISPLAQATAANLAAINGFGADNPITSLTLSPNGDGNEDIVSSVSQQVPIIFAAGFLGRANVPVSANSYVELSTVNATPCLYATRFGIDIGLGGKLIGPACTIQTASPVWGTLTDALGSTIDVGAVNLGLTGLWAQLEPLSIGIFEQPTPPVKDFNYGVPAMNYLAQDSQILAATNTIDSLADTPPAAPTADPPGLPAPLFTGKSQGTLTAQDGQTLSTGLINSALAITGVSVTFAQPNNAEGCSAPMIIAGPLTLSQATATFKSGCYEFAGPVSAAAGTSNIEIAPGANVIFEFQLPVIDHGDLTIGPVLPAGDQSAAATYYFAVGAQNAGAGTLTLGTGKKVFGAGLPVLGGLIPGAGLSNTGGGAVRVGDGDLYVENSANITNNSGSMTIGNGNYNLYGGSILTLSGSLSMGNGTYSLYGGSIETVSGATTLGKGNFNLYPAGFLNASGNIQTITGSTTFGDGNVMIDGGNLLATSGNTTFGDGTVDLYGAPGGNILAGTGSNLTFGVGNVNIHGAGNIILDGNNATFGKGGSAADGAGAINIANDFLGGTLALLSGNLIAKGVSINDGSGGGMYLGGGGTLSSPLVQVLQAFNLPTSGLVGSIDLTAPTVSNPAFGEQDVAIALTYDPLGDWAGPNLTMLQDTTSNTIAGAIYDPAGAVNLEFASVPGPSLSPPAGGCLEIYGAKIQIEQWTVNVSSCPGLKGTPSSTISTVALAQ